MGIRDHLRGFASLMSFLTRLPIGASDLESAAKWFHLAPLVGVVEGLIIGLALATASALGSSPAAAAGIYVLAHILVTGGIHLDGLADYSDVLGSGARGRRAEEILSDPRRGSFALIAVSSATVAGALFAASIYESLSSWGAAHLIVPLMALCYASSLESSYLAILMAPPSPRGLGGAFRVSMSGPKIVSNIILYSAPSLAVIAATYTYSPGAAAAMAAGALASLLPPILVSRDAASRLGRASGDAAGFSAEASRILFLASSSVVAGVAGG